MDNEKNISNGAPENEDDVILPEGYEDENLFDEPSGDDENIFGKEDTLEGFGGEDNGAEDPAPENQPEEQKPEKENGVAAEVGENSVSDPAQQQEVDGFRFQYNGQEVTVTQADLPELYRKAQEHGAISAMQAEANDIAKTMGFNDVKAMMAKALENYREGEIRRLVDSGSATEEVARFMVETKMQAARPQTAAPNAQTAPRRGIEQFRQELNELVAMRPDLKESLAGGGQLPQEVVTGCVKSGIPLRTAYAEYEAKEARANAERIRQENEILKQNEQNAKKAPVKSVTAGGGVKAAGKDPFLVGFEAD